MPLFSNLHFFITSLLMLLMMSGGLAQEAPDYVEGEVLVTFKNSATQQSAETSLKRKSLRFTRRFERISSLRGRPMGLVRHRTQSTLALIAELKTDPNVEMVEPNYLRHIYALPNDARFSELWGLKNTGQTVNKVKGTSGADVSYEAAWNKAREVTDTVVVGVIDTGVEFTHPDLLPRMWTNSQEIPNNSLDDDNNGYTDDYYGFDFIGDSTDVRDADVHGTHVSGTIAAQGNNNQGVIGINDRVKIMALKVSENGDTMSSSAIIEAIEYAIMMKQRGVPIVALNASYGGTSFSNAERNAIASAGSAGIILCAAAGNSDNGNNNDISPEYPASYNLSNIITVAATDSNDSLAKFSHYGKTSVDLAAPGVNILSTVPTVKIQVGAKSYEGTRMTFSGHVSEVTGQIIYCGLGKPENFPASVNGYIALIERGDLFFYEKAANARAAGAVAAIIYNNAAGSFGGTLQDSGSWIPTLAVSREDGLAIKNALPTSGTLSPGNSYGFLQGTSMAAPHVTGAVAFAAINFPNETVSERVQRILRSVDLKSSLQDKMVTGGRLNLQKIVDADLDGIPDWLTLDLAIQTAANLPSSLRNEAYTQTITTTAGTAPYSFRIGGGTLPAGLTLSTSGILSGTPTEAGKFVFTVMVSDDSGKTGGKIFTLYIAPEPLQISSNETLPGGYQDSPYTETLVALGGSSPYMWTLSSGSLPEGLTLSNTGVISGLPTTVGTSTFTVKAEDAGLMMYKKEFSLTITPSPIQVLTENQLAYGLKSVSYNMPLEAEGGTPPYEWRIYSGNLPSGLGLASSGVIVGKPTAPGNYQFRLVVEDAEQLITSRLFNLEIRSVYTTPMIASLNLGSTYIGADYSATPTTEHYPTSFQITGLPRGLKYSSKTGIISGHPQQAGEFTVQAIAKNPAGTSPVKSEVIIIRSLDSEWIGNYNGVIRRSDTTNQLLGSRFSLTTTSLGAYSLKITTGGKSRAVKGYLKEVSPQISLLFDGHPLDLTLDPTTGNVSGSHGGAIVDGWRIPWHAKSHPASKFSGYYSAALNPVKDEGLGDSSYPQGTGYLTMNIKTSGFATVTGRSASGDKLTSSFGLGSQGEAGFYQSLYKHQGSILGTFTVDDVFADQSEDNALSGTLSWRKPMDASRLYPAGFKNMHLDLQGGYLAAKASGGLVQGLPTQGAADLIFGQAGLSFSDTDPNILGFTSDASFNPALPKAGGASNPAFTTLKINKASGLVLGTFTLIENSTLLKRKVTFQGMIVPQAQIGVKAQGYFLLPQIPVEGQKANSTPILSGGFQIQQDSEE